MLSKPKEKFNFRGAVDFPYPAMGVRGGIACMIVALAYDIISTATGEQDITKGIPH